MLLSDNLHGRVCYQGLQAAFLLPTCLSRMMMASTLVKF
jgi:hypothetical protein